MEKTTASVTQECPNCQGILPREAITIGPWMPYDWVGLATGECVRRIDLLCPHCGHRAVRHERKSV